MKLITALPTLALPVLENSNQAQFQSACHWKPPGTQNAVENGLTTPKSSFENDKITKLTFNN
ncbi:TPA: hypothetical protein NKU96_004877 [Vibrio parahaemolyticus]|nr:hypothetical protein [Vibrio parahaemolyticus]